MAKTQAYQIEGNQPGEVGIDIFGLDGAAPSPGAEENTEHASHNPDQEIRFAGMFHGKDKISPIHAFQQEVEERDGHAGAQRETEPIFLARLLRFALHNDSGSLLWLHNNSRQFFGLNGNGCQAGSRHFIDAKKTADSAWRLGKRTSY